MEMLLELCERPPSAAGHMVRAPAPQGTVDRCTTEGRGQGMLGEDVGIELDQGKALSREEAWGPASTAGVSRGADWAEALCAEKQLYPCLLQRAQAGPGQRQAGNSTPEFWSCLGL